MGNVIQDAKFDSGNGIRGITLYSDAGHINVAISPPHSPVTHSVTEFIVAEDKRGKGEGKRLIRAAMKKFREDIGAQCSSIASVKAFYSCGFHYAADPTASLEECIAAWREWSSILMVYKPKKEF